MSLDLIVGTPLCSNPHGGLGSSLIEFVVAIAVIRLLIALALPSFNDARRDSQLSQAKNTLAILYKECVVAQARVVRGGDPLL